MKESKFNLFYELEGDANKFIAYNSRTNALATMDREDLQKLKDYTNCSKSITDEKLIENLKKGGFLIDKEIDELEVLKYVQLASRFGTTSLGLTIAPTLGCNFDCIYCYEKDHDDFKKMSEEVQNNLINFIENQANTLNNVSIAWYGGEPLLAFDVIENLSNKLIDLCNKNNINYSASLVTNGYLLTRDIVSKLKDLKIGVIQVTLDGPKDIHDKRRFLRNGQPTFDRILENLIDVSDISPQISLRINIDKENQYKTDDILNILVNKGLDNKVYPYLGYVEPTNDCYSKNTCLNVDNFSNIEYVFYDTLSEKNFYTDIMLKYPRSISNNCCADRKNAFVVDPKGNLYKCWSDIGMIEHCVGNLKDGLKISKSYINYALYDCTIDIECNECKLIPICMGGCPRRRLDNIVDRCSPYKYTLEKYLQKITKQKLSELDKNKAGYVCN